ncbi:MAG: type VI secretion system ATPase TssH [Endozoicomonas sp. (ex Botrylloides leachii)]|nr:type VI secretion system ATPase TssH [Endozoicomonas sp. (ex Botrylloides leachii)]
MKQLELKQLINRLSSELRQALEGAASFCVRRGHKSIDIEHWLFQLFSEPGKDTTRIIVSQKLSSTKVIDSLEHSLDLLASGFEGTPSLSHETVSLIESACLIATVNFNQTTISSYHLMLALLDKNDVMFTQHDLVSQLQKISLESLQSLAAKTDDNKSSGTINSEEFSSTALEKYTSDLTLRAGNKELSTVIGRDKEIRQMVDILSRRRQNNPILVGDAGVGKTAIVEGLAQYINEKEVPESLWNFRVLSLDLGLLQAGASIKGEFESRLKDLINEVKQSETPIILFIDEAHTLIGAGGSAGQNDAANLLKPALARGEFLTIAATTWAEYKKFFEKDAALTRRFQPISVQEPDEVTAIHMVRAMVPVLEKHHSIRIHEDAVVNAVTLSIRYLTERLLPDKAISLLDTACSRVSLSQKSTPQQIQALKREQQYLTAERIGLVRDQVVSVMDQERLDYIDTESNRVSSALKELEERWHKEKLLVSQIAELEQELDKQYLDSADIDLAKKEDILRLASCLKELQKEDPLLFSRVDSEAVAAVVSSWTGIPAGNMIIDEIEQLLDLENLLRKRVVGQDQAIKEISDRIRIGRTGLSDPEKPIGVFLACGPSGVGKTETGLALADLLYGGRRNLIVINMTEFKEQHKVSALLGAPAGYVGYGEGGVLTEAVRRHPYSVLVLDEMEKAHPSVHDIFYQIFDKGRIKDSEGREVSFQQTVIIMTSNAADIKICDIVNKYKEQKNRIPNVKEIISTINDDLLRLFKPAFLGRLSIVPYIPLNDEELYIICRMKLSEVEENLYSKYKASMIIDDAVIHYLVNRNKSPETGARSIDQLINRRLSSALANECLTRLAKGELIYHIHVGLEDDRLVYNIE